MRTTSTTFGFARTSKLLQGRIRKASETRGFAVSKLLTHWAEVVGPDLAAITRPIEVGYQKKNLGATLTILTTGANAPMVEMQKVKIKEAVNACYGYGAVARIHITQTAATGFAEGRADFAPAPKAGRRAPPEVAKRAAQEATKDIKSDDLRVALEALGANILAKSKSKE